MMNPKRTQIAQAAFDFSTYFGEMFRGLQVQGSCLRRPALIAPEGMSTAGGKKALQHIVLRPDEPSAGSVLTVGWVDVAARVVHLRSFECLLELHRQRFGGRPFDVESTSYVRFFEQARQFFGSLSMQVEVETQAPQVPTTKEPAPASRHTGGLIALLVVALIVLLALLSAGTYLYLSHRAATEPPPASSQLVEKASDAVG